MKDYPFEGSRRNRPERSRKQAFLTLRQALELIIHGPVIRRKTLVPGHLDQSLKTEVFRMNESVVGILGEVGPVKATAAAGLRVVQRTVGVATGVPRVPEHFLRTARLPHVLRHVRYSSRATDLERVRNKFSSSITQALIEIRHRMDYGYEDGRCTLPAHFVKKLKP